MGVVPEGCWWPTVLKDKDLFKVHLARMTSRGARPTSSGQFPERGPFIKHPDSRRSYGGCWNFPLLPPSRSGRECVYHRSYEEREPIEVRIKNDELVVLSSLRSRPVDPDGRPPKLGAQSVAAIATGASVKGS